MRDGGWLTVMTEDEVDPKRKLPGCRRAKSDGPTSKVGWSGTREQPSFSSGLSDAPWINAGALGPSSWSSMVLLN